MSEDPGVLLPTDALLRIDVAGEIRKLAGAQLQGDWQLITECLRLVLAQGATRVEIELGPGRFILRAHGWRIDPAVLLAAVALRKGMREPQAAHAALIELEAKGALALLVIAGTPRIATRVVGPSTQGHMRLKLQGEDATLRPDTPPLATVAEWTVSGLEYDKRRARRHCLDAARFAEAEVRIDGQAPPTAFAGAIDVIALSAENTPAQSDSAPALRGSLAICRDADTPRIWITRAGVLAAHFTAASGPAFELCVEVGDQLDPRATGADLRRFGEAALPGATFAFVRRLSALARQTRPPQQRRQLALLCIQGLGLPEHTRALATIPVFDRVGAEGQVQPLSLLELRGEAQQERGRRCLIALRPLDNPADYDLGSGAVILDDELRARLAARLELDIEAPPLTPSSHGFNALARRALRSAWARLTDLGGTWGAAPPELPGERLAPHERELLTALSTVLGPQRRVALCDGDFAARWSRATVWLAREDPTVAAALARCSSDPAWCYPAALALGEGRASAHALRKRWRPSSWIRMR